MEFDLTEFNSDVDDFSSEESRDHEQTSQLLDVRFNVDDDFSECLMAATDELPTNPVNPDCHLDDLEEKIFSVDIDDFDTSDIESEG